MGCERERGWWWWHKRTELARNVNYKTVNESILPKMGQTCTNEKNDLNGEWIFSFLSFNINN